MNIVIGSIFRNSTSYLNRYFNQVARLTEAMEAAGHTLSMILVEGDSTDDTYAVMRQRIELETLNAILLKCEHGGPVFGSIDNETRWRNISKVCNHLLNNTPKCDILIYVESDILWTPETMMALIDHIPEVDIIAPMCFHLPTGKFYDTFGYRKNGEMFSYHSPYHPSIDRTFAPGETIPIDCAGSCFIMKGEVTRLARFSPPELCIVGFGQDARQWGFSYHLDPNQRVYHP
jgi:hypothetical protein